MKVYAKETSAAAAAAAAEGGTGVGLNALATALISSSRLSAHQRFQLWEI